MAGELHYDGSMGFRETITRLLAGVRTGALSMALVIPGVTAYSFAEARTLSVTSDVITSASVPQELEGARIVFVSDVHAGPYFGPGRMDALVDQVNALEPDVLILGGDYVGGRANGAEVFYERAGGFRARLARIAVLGNHDVWEGAETARDGLAEAGFSVLENESALIDAGGAAIAVAGVDDLYTGDPDPEAASRGIPEDAFAVLVSHNPDVFADLLGATAGRWDLALAGHTHGGQVTLFGLGGHVPSDHGQRYRSGWMDENDTRILVSNGVGSVTLPVRLFARPEIHVITLDSQADAGVATRD